MTRSPADTLESLQTRIGHAFQSSPLLTQALTHISVTSSDRRRAASYQRLEFLGDRVLGLVVSAMLYAEFPDAEEGEMSRRLAALVRRETCGEVAIEWKIGPLIRLGESEAAAGGRAKVAILADVCEAIIGAIFVDGGYLAAERTVRAAWTPRMRAPTRPLRDPKTALQEWAQGLGKPAPVYREVERSGPDHAPKFTVGVTVDGFSDMTGTGSSKRNAEQAAAEAFLAGNNLAHAAGVEL